MGATIRDVAKKTGLSLGTISKYINGQPVREANRVLIEQAIAELQFKPNKIAKGLRNSQTFSVARTAPHAYLQLLYLHDLNHRILPSPKRIQRHCLRMPQ